MQYLLTFLEGLMSFISPCMLPLLPLFISYFVKSDDSEDKKGLLLKVLMFVLGFSIVFCLLGALAGSLGAIFAKYKDIVNIVCGALIILFGLSYIGIINLGFLKGIKNGKKIETAGSAFVFGCIYSISLTPCVGALLGSALAQAASSRTALNGVVLLLFYSLGLGVPFVVSALLLDKLKKVFNSIKKHYKIINTIAGCALILIGSIMIFKSAFTLIKAGSERVKLESAISNAENLENEYTITLDNFEEEVLKSDIPVLVDFWASWCPPCKMLSPVISEIADEKKGKLKVGKVNVDEQQVLSSYFSINSIPTLILFEDGKVKKISRGYMDKSTLLDYFEIK